MNAANESAVAAFLKDDIPFYGISDIVGECMEKADYIAEPTLEDIFQTNSSARALADGMILQMKKKS